MDTMSAVAEMVNYKFNQVETLVFAGGGNRCWWQAGLLTQLFDSGFERPQRFVGTSGGAAVAASLLTHGAQHALDTCITAYAANPSIFDFSRRPKLRFAHTTIYPAWIASFLNAESFSKFRASTTTLTVAVTRPTKLLGVGGSALAGTLAYLVEKYWSKSLHPKLPKRLGLRQDFLTICADTSIDAAQTLLVASATAPPIMPARRVNGDFALDGGFVDNVPVEEQTLEQRRRTLVLLTRHYPGLPTLFTLEDRAYLQPSTKVPVSTWDCTAKTDVTRAFEMGRRDALSSMQSGLLTQSV
jgi:predicted acylesterase/phospholipase RssA